MVPAARTIQYGYAQTGWKDLMTSYNGQSITYDEIGNPLTYRDGMTMTWTGRQLTTLTQNGKQNTYKYDVDGLRLEKTAGGVTTQYQYVNGQLLGEKRSNGVILRYTYDALGALSGIQYKNTAGVTTNYIVRCTLSGDVDQIYDTKGSLVARYIYDTWGNTLSVTDASGKAITDPLHIANINPIRYRGYYYDAETGLYYLQSRYYDTSTRRFLNADTLLGANAGAAYNLFAYCGNNPINMQDSDGLYPIDIDSGGKGRIPKGYSIFSKKTSKAKTNTTVYEESQSSLANHVEKVHVTTPTAMVNLGTLFGKVGFSTTVTKQNKELGLLHTYSDIGNDASKYAAGINIIGWLGIDIGVSSEKNAFASVQITPWIHGEVSLGLDGIGAVVGFDNDDTSYDFEINGGWGIIAIFAAPQILAGGQMNGTPAY